MKKKIKLFNDWLNSGSMISVRQLAVILLLSMALAVLLTVLELHIRKL